MFLVLLLEIMKDSLDHDKWHKFLSNHEEKYILVAGDQCDEVLVTLEQKLPELSCFRADSRFALQRARQALWVS